MLVLYKMKETNGLKKRIFRIADDFERVYRSRMECAYGRISLTLEPEVSKRCQGIVSRVSESFNGSKGIVSSIRFRVSKKLLDVSRGLSSTPKHLFNIFESVLIDSLKYFPDAFESFLK